MTILASGSVSCRLSDAASDEAVIAASNFSLGRVTALTGATLVFPVTKLVCASLFLFIRSYATAPKASWEALQKCEARRLLDRTIDCTFWTR